MTLSPLKEFEQDQILGLAFLAGLQRENSMYKSVECLYIEKMSCQGTKEQHS